MDRRTTGRGGVKALGVEAWPPQVSRVPSFFKAYPGPRAPMLTCFTFDTPLSCCGAGLAVVVPLPYAPVAFHPHAQTAPAESMANVVHASQLVSVMWLDRGGQRPIAVGSTRVDVDAHRVPDTE